MCSGLLNAREILFAFQIQIRIMAAKLIMKIRNYQNALNLKVKTTMFSGLQIPIPHTYFLNLKKIVDNTLEKLH